jgi:hypothetical protein
MWLSSPALPPSVVSLPDTGRKQGTQLFPSGLFNWCSPDGYISSSYMPSCHGPGFPFVGSTVPLRLNLPRFMLRRLFSCFANAAKKGKDKLLSGDQARPDHFFLQRDHRVTNQDSNTRMMHGWTSHALSGDGLGRFRDVRTLHDSLPYAWRQAICCGLSWGYVATITELQARRFDPNED